MTGRFVLMDALTDLGRTAAGRWRALSANGRGVAWVLVSSAGFSVMSALVKTLGQTLDSFQIVFFRAAIGMAILVPLVVRAGPSRVLRTTAPWIHLARAVSGTAALMCGFYAVTHLPLATAAALTFTKPLFLIVLAVLFLGEVVRWRRWTATLVGFAGVLIILRPWHEAVEPAMAVALLQALAVACSVMFIKLVPADEPHLGVLFSFAAFTTLVTFPFALAVWRPPTAGEWGLAVVMAAIGLGAQTAVVHGYRTGDSTVLAPFDYSRLLFATLIGLAVFGETPGLWEAAGAALIITSTAYVARREARLNLPAKVGPAPH